MNMTLRPATEWELAMMVADAANAGRTVELLSGMTKRAIGRPVQAASGVDLLSLRGINFYAPTELVMRARAGTLLTDIETELASRGQMLAFEPLDLSDLLGTSSRTPTIGGVVATNFSGSRRIANGSARDHVIGMRAVTGQAQIIVSGGRVLKNVTGYDLPRLLTGSHGTLAAITEVTFKVLPRPEATATLLIKDLPDALAIEALCAAMSTPYEVTGAIHIPAAGVARFHNPTFRDIGGPLTALRLENFAPSISYRTEKLKSLLGHFGEIAVMDTDTSLEFWHEIRHLTPVNTPDKQLWRISTKPTLGPVVVNAIARYMDVEAFYDWSGGLIWLLIPLSNDAGVTDIRRVIALYGGHATLIKADPGVRASIDVFQPLEPGLKRLTEKLKQAIDPFQVFNPGRMYAAI